MADRDTEQQQQQPTVSAEAAVTAKQLRDTQQQLKQTSLTVQGMRLTRCGSDCVIACSGTGTDCVWRWCVLSGLEEQLRSSQQHAQQYQLMADALEKNLAETTQVALRTCTVKIQFWTTSLKRATR